MSTTPPVLVEARNTDYVPQTEVGNLPHFALKSSNRKLVGEGFVVVMIDPDSPPEFAQVRHLVLEVDVPYGADISRGAPLFNSTHALADYVAPDPTPGPAHR